MRVLFFSHQAEFIYGGEIVTLAFMHELKTRGVEVHFASPAGPYQERAREIAICHSVSSRQFSRKWKQLPGIAGSLFSTTRELRQLTDFYHFDLIHATSLKAMAFAWAAGRTVPVIWHHHDILPATPANSLWQRALSSRARRILAPSGATRSALLAAGVEPAKVHVLRNGFSLREWQPRPARDLGKRALVGLVGEISPRKGTDRLEAVLAALPKNAELEFLVVGEGLSHPAYAKTIRTRLEGARVRFAGRLEEMKALYQQLDLLLVLSRQDPLPTVIVEAGLSGLPVVGARAGGIPEMVVEGKNGFLFDTEAEAASAILRALSDWPRLAQGARAVAEERYDLAKLTDELLLHFEGVRKECG